MDKIKVKEIQRHARTGEYIKIVNAGYWKRFYKNGDIVRVVNGSAKGSIVSDIPYSNSIYDAEYVVLENYQPKMKIMKSDVEENY